MRLIKTIIKIIAKTAAAFLKPCIVFESIPDFSDNTRCVYDEMIKRGYDKKYYMIWQIEHYKISLLGDKNGWFINRPKNTKQLLLSISFKFKKKCSIYGNRIFSNDDNKETVFFLNHGAPFKATKGYYEMPEFVDYVLSLSEYLAPIAAEQGNVPVEKMFSLGFPRNDILTKSRVNLKKILKTELKIIVWYPTYRQNKNSNIHISEKALPLICDSVTAQEINDCAKKNNVLIFIKPHFVQDLDYFKVSELSNIKAIDDSFFETNGLTSYEFVGASDALLTDYSSIYYDYILCDKPIGVVWTDFESYKKSPGFAVDVNKVLKGAVKILDLDDLKTFISDLNYNNDQLKKERKEVREKIVQFTDGNSTKRVTNYIIKKANI